MHSTPATRALPKLNGGSECGREGSLRELAEQRERAWPLQREHRGGIALVADGDRRRQALGQPGEVGCPVRRVHDQEIAVVPAVDDQVVGDAPRLVGQERVLRLALRERAEIV